MTLHVNKALGALTILVIFNAATAEASARLNLLADDHRPPGPTRTADVHKTKFGVVITGQAREGNARTRARRGDLEGGSRRGGVVGKRGVSAEERARAEEERKADCAASARVVFEAEDLGAVGARLSADGCRIEWARGQRDEVRVGVREPVRVTAGMVITEVRKVGFAGSRVHVEPLGGTLVNLDTNFYADPHAFDQAVEVLGQSIPVKATPKYTWRFGDGARLQTDGPGAPYPAGDVTHRYKDRGPVVVSVTLNYDTWFRLPGEGWQSAGVVDIAGPATQVQVCEARPVLVDPDNPSQYEPPKRANEPCTA